MCKGRKYRVLSWVLTVVMLFGMVVTPVSATSTADTDAAIMEQADGSTDESGDLTVSSEDESQTEEEAVQTGEDESQTEEEAIQTEEDASQVEEDEAQTGDNANLTEEDASQNEGDLSQSGDDVNQSEDVMNEAEPTEESSEILSAVDELQAQIDALPTVDEVASMDLEGQNEVYAQASAIWDAYYELTEDEQEQVDVSALEQLADYFNGGVVTTSSTTQESTSVASVTIDGTTTYYDSINDALGAVIAGTTGTVTLLCNATLSGTKVLKGNLTLDLGGYTLTTGSYTLSIGSDAVVSISNGSITGSAAGSQSGIIKMTYSSTSLTMNDVTVTNTTTSTSTSNVVYLDPSKGINFEATDCTFTISSSNGRAIAGGSGSGDSKVVLTGCTLTSAYRTLVLTGTYSVFTIDGCTIKTTSTDSSDAAIYLSTSKTTSINIVDTTIDAQNGAASIGSNNSSSATSCVYLSGYTVVTSLINNTSGGHRIVVSGGYYKDSVGAYVLGENVFVSLADGYTCVELTETEKAQYPGCYYKVIKEVAETFTVYYNTTTSYTIEYVAGESYDLTQPYSDELGYGVSDGCLYAGLYIDREHAEPLDGTTALGNGLEFYPEAGEIYYVKEISDHYLQVKCLYAWTDADGIVNLWPVTGIDDDSYSEIGFIIDDDSTYTTGTIGETGTKLTDTSPVAAETEIYESLDVEYPNAEKGYESVHTTCMELYQVSGYLAVTQELDDLLSEYNDDDEITMQAYYVTQDGVMVTGAYSRTITFKDNFSDFEVEDTNVGSETSYPTDSGSAVMLLSLAVSSSCVLMASVPEETTYTVTKYDDGVIYTQEVSEDDTDVEITYAGKEGYLFGGWFEDEACTVAADFSNIDSDMTVYAKYVSDDYMQVKIVVQSTRGVVKTLRFISAVDCKNYAEVGFEYEYNGTQESVEVTKYSTTASGYTAVKLFGGDVITGSKLIYNDFSVSKISAGTEITITPYWVTMDGTKVYGTSRTVTFTGTTVE